MLISLHVLHTIAPTLSSLSVDEIASRLTLLGIEVEHITHFSAKFKSVVVGKIVETTKHPNAEKLTLCKVDVGNESLLNIICGDPTVHTNQFVAVATIGAILPFIDEKEIETNFEITKKQLRGVYSEGMLCSEKELGISNISDHILSLNASYQLGKNLSEYYSDDTIFDLSITPNRSDAISHVGIVRELVGAQRIQNIPTKKLSFQPSPKRLSLEDASGCPYFNGVIIENISVAPSPAWLQHILRMLGQSSINNIVDITNYISLLYGKPMHAFDYDKLIGGKIRVRNDITGKFIALNKKEYLIEKGMTMICDEKNPVAIAGIIGGLNSSVTNTTKNILIESAYFSPEQIRKTTKKLGLQTDASYRFERGVDVTVVPYSSELGAQLILDLAGGIIKECFHNEYTFPPAKEIVVDLAFVHSLIGLDISKEIIKEKLAFIGIECINETKNADRNINKNIQLTFSVPSYRLDILEETDIVEEIARLYGYNNIPESDRLLSSYPARYDETFLFETQVKQCIMGFGFAEIITIPLLSQKEVEMFSEHAVHTCNALNQDLTSLRSKLLPSFLKTISYNQNRNASTHRIFELGNVYEENADTKENLKTGTLGGYSEKTVLGFALCGKAYIDTWHVGKENKREYDFYDLKGIVTSFIKKLNSTIEIKLAPCAINSLLYEISILNLQNGNKKNIYLGTIEIVDKKILSYYKIDHPVYHCELDFDTLKKVTKRDKKSYHEPSKFPSVSRDVAFYLSNQSSVQQVIETMRWIDPSISDVTVFDVYEDEAKANERSIGFRFTITNFDQTLTDDQIQLISNQLITTIEKDFGGVLRKMN